MLGRENGRVFLRAALGQLGQRRRLGGRALFAGAATDDGLLDLIYLNFEQGIENSIEAAVPIGVNTAFGDGVILDWFSKFGKWVIEHQDEILAFIKAIFSLFAGI